VENTIKLLNFCQRRRIKISCIVCSLQPYFRLALCFKPSVEPPSGAPHFVLLTNVAPNLKCFERTNALAYYTIAPTTKKKKVFIKLDPGRRIFQPQGAQVSRLLPVPDPLQLHLRHLRRPQEKLQEQFQARGFDRRLSLRSLGSLTWTYPDRGSLFFQRPGANVIKLFTAVSYDFSQ
jgi:hypothetical protein